MSFREKLHPRRFAGMSGQMAAIVGCILGEKFTNPAMAELAITSDGCLLARLDGDCGMNEFLGSASDLERNWRNLITAAELDATETKEAQAAFTAAIQDHRRKAG